MTRFINFICLGMLFSCLFLCSNAFSINAKPVTIKIDSVTLLDENLYKADLSFKVQQNWHVYAHDENESGLPLKIELIGGDGRIIEINWPESIEESLESEGIAVKTKFYKDEFQVSIKFQTNHSNKVLFKVELGACNQVCISQTEEISVEVNKGCKLCDLLFYGLLGILGGFILNLMPCVFPVVALKALALSNTRTENIKQTAFFTTAGILFSFMALALITVLLKNLGDTVGWGLHFQSSYFVIFLAFVMILFAYNLNGDFEILYSVNDRSAISKLGENSKNFFIGATATLMATPCTAPFLSAAVAFALTQHYFVIFYIYLMLGIGMALPFIAISIYPKAGKFLPKSGNWMLMIKKIFAILFLLTAFWLLYILYYQISLSSLLAFIGFLILLKFIFRFSYFYQSLIRLFAVILVFILAIYSSVFLLETRKLEAELSYSEGWVEYSDEVLNKALEGNNLIFIDVTAEWCVTCKLNKLTTLGNEEVVSFLKENKVILLRADVTNSNESVINLMKRHDRFGVPLNVIYSQRYKNGYLLPHILTPNIIYEAVKENRRAE